MGVSQVAEAEWNIYDRQILTRQLKNKETWNTGSI